MYLVLMISSVLTSWPAAAVKRGEHAISCHNWRKRVLSCHYAMFDESEIHQFDYCCDYETNEECGTLKYKG